MHTKFWSENLHGKHHVEELGVGECIILEWILGKQDGNVWTGFIWLRKENSGGLF
jgi:hypothetical protein